VGIGGAARANGLRALGCQLWRLPLEGTHRRRDSDPSLPSLNLWRWEAFGAGTGSPCCYQPCPRGCVIPPRAAAESVPSVQHHVLMFEMLAAAVVEEVTKVAVDSAEGWPGNRRANRADRMDAYLALQRSVVRSQLRIDTMFSVHSAQYNVANVAAWITGYPLV